MDFINGFLEYTRLYESPTSFWKWAGFSVISAVLRDSCWKNQGDNLLFPNIYVLLLADSAIQRKDKPVDLARQFITPLHNTKVIVGRASIQGILDELIMTETDKKTGRILEGGSAIFIAPELSAGIVSDPQSVNILTDMYGYREVFTERLRGHGKFEIKKLCFSALMASNKALLTDIYDIRAMQGGLLGRTFLVVPNEWRPGNSLFSIKHKEITFDVLLNELKEIMNLRGEFSFTPQAEKEYDDWYLPFRESYRSKPDKSGIAGRVHTGILKLAMILCVNHTKELLITHHHIEESIGECMSLMANYQQLVMGTGKSSNAEIGSIILNEIYKSPNHTTSQKKMLQEHWSSFDIESLTKFIDTMSTAGMIEVVMLEDGPGYRLTKKCLELLFKGEEKKK